MRERVDIDRLRALHVRLAAYLTRADVLEMVSAVPALLDAAEERDRLRQSLDAANDALDASGKTTFRIREERDAARAQLDAVKGVRELIGILLDAWEQVPNDAKTDEWGHVNNLLAQLSWEIEQDAALTPTKEPDRG